MCRLMYRMRVVRLISTYLIGRAMDTSNPHHKSIQNCPFSREVRGSNTVQGQLFNTYNKMPKSKCTSFPSGAAWL